MGLGVLVFSFQSPRALEPLVETYKTNIEKAEPVGAFVHDRIMAIAPLLCLPDGDEARSYYAAANAGAVSAHFSVYFDTIPDYAAKLADEPRPIPQTRLRELIDRAATDPDLKGPVATGEIDESFLYQNGICVGDPEDVAKIVQRYADIGLDELVLIPSAGCPHPKTLESIALTGAEVIPRFRG